jgi:Domain of unknown function (DUF4932)
MRYNLFFVLTIVLNLNAFAQSKGPIVLKSLSDSFTYKESGIAIKFPIVDGDTTAFGTNYYGNVFKLATEIDSVSVRFNPKLKPQRQSTLIHITSPKGTQVFYLIFNPLMCWFTDTYMERAKDHVQYDIPEAYELANVLYSLTRSSAANNNRTLKNTAYFDRMLHYFGKYRNHPLIQQLEFPDDINGSTDYYNFRDNSFCYTIKNGNVVPNGQYYVVWGEPQKNLFAKHLALINDFYHRSAFHRFFISNRLYYDSMIKRQQQLMPAQKMWQWLEKNFQQKIQSYRMVFSPLINGSHGTQIFYWIPAPKNFFAEAVMFTSGPRNIDKDEDLTEKQKEGISSGVLFTEIDHNYCNPVADRYQKQIDSAFSNRTIWVTSGGDAEKYPSPMAVFNEYITHAVYLLYAWDNFQGDDFALIRKNREDLMMERRKYIKFKAFSDKLLELYSNRRPDQTVKDLFPAIIGWCKNQN